LFLRFFIHSNLLERARAGAVGHPWGLLLASTATWASRAPGHRKAVMLLAARERHACRPSCSCARAVCIVYMGATSRSAVSRGGSVRKRDCKHVHTAEDVVKFASSHVVIQEFGCSMSHLGIRPSTFVQETRKFMHREFGNFRVLLFPCFH